MRLGDLKLTETGKKCERMKVGESHSSSSQWSSEFTFVFSCLLFLIVPIQIHMLLTPNVDWVIRVNVVIIAIKLLWLTFRKVH